MVTYQWSIFWVDLDPTRGSEQAGIRPVLVISVEEVNQVLPVVTVLPLTSVKPGRRVYSVEVLLKAADTGLLKDFIAMAHQIRAVSKERLGERCGTIINIGIRRQVWSVLRRYLDMQ